MAITVKKELINPASGKNSCEWRFKHYLEPDGLKCREFKEVESQADTLDYEEYRDSMDNGKSWGEWIRKNTSSKKTIGDDEIERMQYRLCRHVWNPVHKHYLSLFGQCVHVGGYAKATEEYWSGGRGQVYHSTIEITDRSGNLITQNIKYEDGCDFNENNYHKTDYLETNTGLGMGLEILKNGDIIFGLSVSKEVCCKRLGLDINKVSPSAPKHMDGLIVCRGKWNAELSCYDLSFPETFVLDDRISGRGIAEPIFAELKSGKILLVTRASNVRFEEWGSRISPYAPSFKFYSISDEKGENFSPLMPWYFNTREVVYSSATYSLFFRSRKNGKLYWFGNITEPTNTYANDPRFPLQMVEVDEEWGCAKKETMTIIDTRHENETEHVQLSNFSIFDNRETGDIELYLAKINQFYPQRPTFDCETWQYTITVD